MKKLTFLLAVILCSCQQNAENKVEPSYHDKEATTIFKNVDYQIIEIDSCEYIIGKDNYGYNGGFFLSHKGNCKFCTERNKRN